MIYITKVKIRYTMCQQIVFNLNQIALMNRCMEVMHTIHMIIEFNYSCSNKNNNVTANVTDNEIF